MKQIGVVCVYVCEQKHFLLSRSICRKADAFVYLLVPPSSR